MPLEIRPLTPALLDDWLHYFDHDAFCDNDVWCGCYCMCYHWTAARNRVKSWSCGRDDAPYNRAEAIKCIGSGVMQGYLAYIDGRPVGWCNAGDKASYDNVNFCPAQHIPDNGERIKSVVCFNVAPAYRHRGIATALLERVCADAKAEGYALVEAYPFAHDEHHAYHGPVALYEKMDFTACATFEGCRVMRRVL